MMDNYKHVTAEWARKTADTVLGNEAKKQLEPCLQRIDEEAKKNKRSVSVSCNINDVAKKELESRGFKLKWYDGDFRDPRESGYWTIEW